MYPSVEPYQHGYLDMGDGHQVYWELVGNPDGLPAVFIHGGPGAGCSPEARRLFDPERYKVLLFDQRGAGRSRPHASLKANTTQHLVADMERLRELAGVGRWLLFGGSWGSTLALAYAQAFPERTLGLVLRGVFTGRVSELRWLYEDGAGWLFPEAWEDFLEGLDAEERHAPVRSYYRRLTDPDPAIRQAAAVAWSLWEASIIQLRPAATIAEAYTDLEFAVGLARIEAHYAVNGFWLSEGQLLDNIGSIAHLPGVIVQGRYDACTPPRTAWELYRRWPASRLDIAPAAGHRFDEPEILSRLIAATDAFAGQLA